MDACTITNSNEKIPCRVFGLAAEASKEVAAHLAALIRNRAEEGRNCVLGLATGSTPTGVYAELVRLHREEGLSFQNVITFNLDEYFPMAPNEVQSYVRFMDENLFNHIDILRENVHLPDGTADENNVAADCKAYENAIVAAGGIDIQILGIGRTGHIGFNEPGSGPNSRTRMITLDRITRRDAAADFFSEENVPRRAITMGVASILDAKQVILMAFGEVKAGVVQKAVEGEISSVIAASYLQTHSNAQFVLDEAASSELTRTKTPWLVGELEWDDKLIREAVIWLATRLEKPILKLTSEDYNEEGLQDLVAMYGPSYDLNIRVFRYLTQTITGWPGGKPPKEKMPGDRRQADEDIFPKTIMIFSPHPDDDVISMGGTLIRLVDQGHDVHVAYQTSGNIAVFDDDAIRFADFAADFNRAFGINPEKSAELESHVEEFLANKETGQVDSETVREIKALIRRSEARAGIRACNVPMENAHFMNMPFYETGRVRKSPLGPEDIKITLDLLRKTEPHQIYCAGDLSDPHGTHRTCLSAVLQACKQAKAEGDAWFKTCTVWLYRGAWQEWPAHQIEMAVPISPEELMRKRVAIFKHESQKDSAMFSGSDPREFWQRAEDRNRDTAQTYDKLGLAEYEAIEAFVEWTGSLDF